MRQARAREEVRSDAREAEAGEEAARGLVLGMMSGEQRRGVQDVERVRDHGARAFGRVARAPELRKELKAGLVEGVALFVRLQAARTRERSIDVDGPVLDSERGIVRDFTREAGVRQLDREITRLGRSVALEVVRATEESAARVLVDVDDLSKYLGKPRFTSDVRERTSQPGVATGLAWTPVGGDILFIETSRMPGKGRLEITGKLGDVMKESARAALSFVKSHADTLAVVMPMRV